MIEAAGALAFVRQHGIALASGKGPVPSVAEAVAGERIKGSWWSHPRGREIFRALEAIKASDEILVCRLVGGKITFVHRRLWPALIRVAGRFEANQLSQVNEEHTPKGHHVSREIPFPDWAPADARAEAGQWPEADALSALGAASPVPDKPIRPTRR